MSEKKEKEPTISEEEFKKLEEEVKEFKDKYMRAIAEAENARKRLVKEKHEMIQHALKDTILEFLHPLDHFENALGFTDQASEEVKNWSHGFHMIHTQFMDVLSTMGITPIEAVGKQFDPNLHEAIETVETEEHPDGTIIDQHMKGYQMGDRTIRPAKVVVAKKPRLETTVESAPEEEQKEENTNG